MRHAIAVFVPSLTCEPFGLVAAEALAEGTCVVCTDWGGVAELLRGPRLVGFAIRTIADGVSALRQAPHVKPLDCIRHVHETMSPLAVASQLMPWLQRVRDHHIGKAHFYSVQSTRKSVQRAFCINLTRRWDRWARMERVLGNIERVEAVDTDEKTRFWTDEEVHGNACRKSAVFLSHLRAWKQAVQRGGEWSLICEDDIYFHDDWESLVSDPGDRNTRLIMLNATQRHALSYGWNQAKGCVLAGAYLIHRDALHLLIDQFSERPTIADLCLVWLQDQVPSVVHYPYLAMQLGSDSDVQTQGHSRDMQVWLDEYMRDHHTHYRFI